MFFDRAPVAGVRSDQPPPSTHQFDLVAQTFEDLNKAAAARGTDEQSVEFAANTAPRIWIVLAAAGVLLEAPELTLKRLEHRWRDVGAAQAGSERLKTHPHVIN